MLRLVTRARGSLRLARGRCPACASETPTNCPVCLGHHTPFPPDARSLRRWASRFDQQLEASVAVGRRRRNPLSFGQTAPGLPGEAR